MILMKSLEMDVMRTVKKKQDMTVQELLQIAILFVEMGEL